MAVVLCHHGSQFTFHLLILLSSNCGSEQVQSALFKRPPVVPFRPLISGMSVYRCRQHKYMIFGRTTEALFPLSK